MADSSKPPRYLEMPQPILPTGRIRPLAFATLTLAGLSLLAITACTTAGPPTTPSASSSGASAPTASGSSNAPRAAAAGPSTSTTEVPELRPGSGTGYLIGYLPRNDLPNSLKLLPPPPAPGTAAAAADEAAYRQTRQMKGTARWTLATEDTNLKFPKAAETFSCALNMDISQDATPHLNMLLRRTLTDAGLATNTAKDFYKRPRPFVVMKEPTCAPAEEALLSRDPAYPSGHAALGWAWAMVLTELAPDHADALMARGYAFGQSRVICGSHWQSDVDSGRLVGAAAVSRLQADATFRAQMTAARAEIAAARARNAKTTRNCQAELNAFKVEAAAIKAARSGQ